MLVSQPAICAIIPAYSCSATRDEASAKLVSRLRIAYVKKWQIFAVGIIAALALWFFPLYQNVIAGAVALLVVGIVGFGFWLRPRRDIFHVRTTAWRVEGDGKLACEHEQLAVKIELARLWLLFVPTALAMTFVVVTSAYGTIWNIGIFDWIPLGYGPLMVNWFTLVLVFGPLYVWLSERRVLREAEAASAQSVSAGGKLVTYVFLDSTGTTYAGEGIYFGLVKSQVLATLVFYSVRNPDLNRIGMRLLFHRPVVIGRGLTDFDKDTVAARAVLPQTTS